MIQHQFVFVLRAGDCCTYCCSTAVLTAVCSKGLVGGWVEGALRPPWWVGGPFRALGSFFVLWEMNLFFC